jgi:acylphosphatase
VARQTSTGPVDLERRDVRFFGHVQGVGFRYTTEALARQWPVTGYVQNMAGGEVRLVIEGRAAELEGLLAAIGARMEGFIERTHVERRAATGEFDRFRIRFGP